MKKLMILMATVFLLGAVVVLTGCGGDGGGEAAKEEATTVAAHDCDGGCGMKAMPADQTVEVDGKFYCKGCAAKAKEHDHEGDHEGHNH